jgi:hypothetical protein
MPGTGDRGQGLRVRVAVFWGKLGEIGGFFFQPRECPSLGEAGGENEASGGIFMGC